MTNKYPGTCYRCGSYARAGGGRFQRHNGGWRVHCQTCVDARRYLRNLQDTEDKDVARGKLTNPIYLQIKKVGKTRLLENIR